MPIAHILSVNIKSSVDVLTGKYDLIWLATDCW